MPLLRSLSMGSTFDRLWGASMTSNFADGMIATAGPLLAVTLTRSPLLISILSSLGSLPWLLFAIPIGGLADRVDRGYALALANAVRFALVSLVVWALVLGHMTLPLLFAVVFLIGVCEVFVDTTTQAVIPMVLEPSQLERGNARLSLAESVIQTFVGAPLSGFLFTAAMALPFILGSVGYAIAALFVLAIARQEHRPLRANRTSEPQHFMADIKEGISFLWHHRTLRNIVLFTTSAVLFFSLSSATMTLFVLDELGVPKAWFGALLSVSGLGWIAGAALATRVSARWGRGRAMVAAMAVSALCTGATGVFPYVWAFLLTGIISSLVISIWNILLMACYQVLIPVELFGRVHGARRTLVWGMGPIGAVVGGWIAGAGLRLPFYVGGVALLLLTAFGSGSILRMTEAAATAGER